MPDKTRPDKQHGAESGKTNWAALDALTDEEAEARAKADPDAPPSPEHKQLRRAALAKRIRLKLVLSEREFAERYRIPLETLAAGERHKAEPDAVAVAFLNAISGDPDGVARALAMSKPAAAE